MSLSDIRWILHVIWIKFETLVVQLWLFYVTFCFCYWFGVLLLRFNRQLLICTVWIRNPHFRFSIWKDGSCVIKKNRNFCLNVYIYLYNNATFLWCICPDRKQVFNQNDKIELILLYICRGTLFAYNLRRPLVPPHIWKHFKSIWYIFFFQLVIMVFD